MDPIAIAALVLVATIAAGILLSVPIAVSIGLGSFFAAIVLLDFEKAALVSSQRLFTGINSFTLLAIPFFVLAGVLMNTGGIAGRLIDAAKVLVGRTPASLANTNVVANAMFGAVSGAAVAAAAAIGTVMTPRMEQEGYQKPWSAAVNVASAPAGMLIPPSNTFIVYALVSGSSISALFIAGVIPGLIWAAACIFVVLLTYRRYSSPQAAQPVTFRQALWVIWRAVPSLLMIVVVVGGIVGGYFTATESSAIAVVYCLVLGFVYRTIKVSDLPRCLLDAARTTAIIMLLVGVSTALSFVMSFSHIPEAVSDLLLGISESPNVILFMMVVILLLVGTFMDPTPAILIFTPIFLPIVTAFEMDPVHFGTMIVYALSVGVITPPVGNVLFVGARVAGLGIEPVVARLVWFLLALIVGLLLVVYVGPLSLWLPDQFGLLSE
ncbi:TRAP transporter large permease [Ornithinicoccus hortensis]|uniref:Tripartite ATP-independent transporter DctM subunit n=1 Tax=Ornithinicoccus hortensis TaxID=82346 RepID=A0A542YNV2_9MICO|nr:TRAP transporter large permease [Ornithinicoccus hortensis]TQL49719.1 tripartite ATP-independent transporter DctM subunit [Ornithinicoccus hortensis]